jgi:hypothetical protein
LANKHKPVAIKPEELDNVTVTGTKCPGFDAIHLRALLAVMHCSPQQKRLESGSSGRG